jgi:hypothetical protein
VNKTDYYNTKFAQMQSSQDKIEIFQKKRSFESLVEDPVAENNSIIKQNQSFKKYIPSITTDANDRSAKSIIHAMTTTSRATNLIGAWTSEEVLTVDTLYSI